MVDVFEEVEGELRSERYRELARRFLPWIVGLLVLALAVALGPGLHRVARAPVRPGTRDLARALMPGEDNPQGRGPFRQRRSRRALPALALHHRRHQVAANKRRRGAAVDEPRAEPTRSRGFGRG